MGVLEYNVSFLALMAVSDLHRLNSSRNPEGPLAASTTYNSLMKFCGYVFVALQVPLHFFSGVQMRIDVFSHLGGAVFGLLGAAAIRWRAHPRSERGTRVVVKEE